MKRSKNKQLTCYISVCCIALAPNSPLLAGFAVQNLLLTVFLCQLASMEEERSSEYDCACYQLKTLLEIWVDEADELSTSDSNNNNNNNNLISLRDNRLDRLAPIIHKIFESNFSFNVK